MFLNLLEDNIVQDLSRQRKVLLNPLKLRHQDLVHLLRRRLYSVVRLCGQQSRLMVSRAVFGLLTCTSAELIRATCSSDSIAGLLGS